MNKIALLIVAVFLCAVSVKAQTVRSDTFLFAAPSTPTATCEQITSWDGTDPAIPPYPYDMGSICLSTGDGAPTSPGSGIFVPFQLGYLNNGDLAGCDAIVWQPKVWVAGDGTHAGDKYTISGSTTCPYYTGEYGPDSPSAHLLDGFSVVADYTMVQKRACPRFRPCYYYLVGVLQGGEGVVEETELP